jgi:NAD(P)-dependent dehydrogenase (short-subunit alcohol dehydrogenase family)
MSSQPLAIVTGANGNLGRAVVARLGSSGMRVARVERSVLHLGEEFDCDLDLSNGPSVARGFAEAARRAGGLAAVVHTVGVYRGGTTINESSDADFLELFQTNVMTTVHVLQAALAVMLPQKSGRIAVVASTEAMLGVPRHSAYAASKGAQLRVVESVAAEVRSHGIAVNAVLPSTMDTPQNRAAMPNANFASWLQLSDVAKVLAQLISSESGPINGQAIRL